jgi:hypothetical protein
LGGDEYFNRIKIHDRKDVYKNQFREARGQKQKAENSLREAEEDTI